MSKKVFYFFLSFYYILAAVISISFVRWELTNSQRKKENTHIKDRHPM